MANVLKEKKQSRGSKSKFVTVNDRMQNGYRYELSEPISRNFDPEFKPELTPQQMLALGVFCGKYMTDGENEFPKSWFKHAKLAPSGRDCSLNYFGVGASRPLSEWRNKGWINPAAGSSGIAVTTWAAVRQKRTSARSSVGRLSGATLHKFE
jgi:hypothetical protein